ncbi:UPF0481 protein-like protein [Tanacetum coccineum]
MILIENQIPFFVLEDIFECTFSKLVPTVPLAKFLFVIQNVCNIFEGNLEINSCNISSTHDHILGFLHKSYQNPVTNSSTGFKNLKAHSVVALDQSGVRFSDNLDSKWPMAMELELSRFLCFPLSWSKPSLKMPILNLSDSTELILRNLIIYEHAAEVPTCVTSYILALDLLVDTPEDVAKLVNSHVLVNGLGSNEIAVGIINNMLKDVPIRDFYYQDEWKQMDEYYNAYWPSLIAELRSKYFSNPWTFISILAAIVPFVFTVVQTVYSIKAGVKNS